MEKLMVSIFFSGIGQITERETAHPSAQQLSDLNTPSGETETKSIVSEPVKEKPRSSAAVSTCS
jgi:hypothetical protein